MVHLKQTLLICLLLALVQHGCGSEAKDACVTIMEQTPCMCEVMEKSQLISVNCSHTNVTYVPNAIPGPLTGKLDMSSTMLSNLAIFNVTPFATFTSLTVLDLYNTSLGLGNATLTEETFVGLERLEHLNISNNEQINITGKSKDNIFAPFAKSLKELRMYATTGTYIREYPLKTLLKLSNLEELWLDGITNITFDVEFGNATKLQTLKIAGDKIFPPWRSVEFCETPNITSQSFSNLVHLKSLSVTKCGVKHIDKDAFEKLTHLKHLDLSGNTHLGIEEISKAAWELSEQLESLELNDIRDVRFTECGLKITKEHTEPLKRLKSLKYLSLAGNALNSIESDAFKALESIEVIDVSRNEFELGLYIFFAHQLTNVTKVNVSFNFFNDDIGVWASLSQNTNSQAVDMEPNSAVSETNVAKKKSRHIHVCPKGDYFIPGCTVTGFLPPNVEEVDLSYSRIGNPIYEICFDSNNNLKTLHLQGSLLFCFDGPVHGLEKLETIHLNKNLAWQISEVFFDGSPNLKHINLNENLLYEALLQVGSRLFLKTPLVEILEMSLNQIEDLPSDMFKHLGNLVRLNLSNNTLKTFEFDMSHMHKLTTIDISFNHIDTINENTRNDLYSIAKTRKGNGTRMEINLTHNNIICSCHNAEFLKWVNNHFGSCSFLYVNITECYFLTDGTTKKRVFRSPADLQKEIDFLDRYCASYTAVIVVGVVILFIFLMIVVGVIVHRFRWKIVYWYYVSSRHKRSAKSRAGYENIDDINEKLSRYKYHVYIVAAQEDTAIADSMFDYLRRKNYKVYFPYDKHTGQPYVGPIAKAVHASRTVLFVVSEGCEHDGEWSVARHLTNEEEESRKRGISVAVLKDRMPESGWSFAVKQMLRKKCSLDYPTQNAGNMGTHASDEGEQASDENNQALEAFYHELIDKIEGLDDTPLTHTLDIEPGQRNAANN